MVYEIVLLFESNRQVPYSKPSASTENVWESLVRFQFYCVVCHIVCTLSVWKCICLTFVRLFVHCFTHTHTHMHIISFLSLELQFKLLRIEFLDNIFNCLLCIFFPLPATFLLFVLSFGMVMLCLCRHKRSYLETNATTS